MEDFVGRGPVRRREKGSRWSRVTVGRFEGGRGERVRRWWLEKVFPRFFGVGVVRVLGMGQSIYRFIWELLDYGLMDIS